MVRTLLDGFVWLQWWQWWQLLWQWYHVLLRIFVVFHEFVSFGGFNVVILIGCSSWTIAWTPLMFSFLVSSQTSRLGSFERTLVTGISHTIVLRQFVPG